MSKKRLTQPLRSGDAEKRLRILLDGRQARWVMAGWRRVAMGEWVVFGPFGAAAIGGLVWTLR